MRRSGDVLGSVEPRCSVWSFPSKICACAVSHLSSSLGTPVTLKSVNPGLGRSWRLVVVGWPVNYFSKVKPVCPDVQDKGSCQMDTTCECRCLAPAVSERWNHCKQQIFTCQRSCTFDPKQGSLLVWALIESSTLSDNPGPQDSLLGP